MPSWSKQQSQELSEMMTIGPDHNKGCMKDAFGNTKNTHIHEKVIITITTVVNKDRQEHGAIMYCFGVVTIHHLLGARSYDALRAEYYTSCSLQA